MLTAFALTQFFAVLQMINGHEIGYRILNNSSDIFHTVYHFNYIIISFIASPSFRHEFVNFYKLNLCFKKLRQLSTSGTPAIKNQVPHIAVPNARVEPYKCEN
uniref:Secreted protein n=1 Tax=Panagrolaimus davidi TaxID=227884 RepID=A0A914PX72_9BILA